METPPHTAPPVDLDRLVLHLHAGQEIATCPHCKGELSKKTPIMKGDENEEVRGRHGVIVAMPMAIDPRPKCPHCYGRFELVIHLQNVKHMHPHPKNSMKTNNNILPQDKIEAQEPASAGCHGAACCASIMEDSSRTTDVRASSSDEVPMQGRVDKMVDVWNLGSRNMGIGLRQVDRRGHQRHRNDIPSKNRGYWSGQQVLETWDCGLDGYKLVLKSGKEVSLTQREFVAWSCNSKPTIVKQKE